MKRMLLAATGLVWRLTPFQWLKKAYIQIFVFLFSGRPIVAEVERVRYELDLREVIDLMLFLERYERDVVRALERYARPGDCVVDIGANIGAHALRLAKLVQPSGRVIAFEPTPFAYNKLRTNIALNHDLRIDAHRVALSDENRLMQPLDVRASWRTDGTAVPTPTLVDFRRFDDWAMEAGLEVINLIKLDVDGAEYKILSGASRSIAKFRPVIVMEVGAWHFEDAGRNPLYLLEKLEYSFIDAASMNAFSDYLEVGTRLPRNDPKMSFSINVIAVPIKARATADGKSKQGVGIRV